MPKLTRSVWRFWAIGCVGMMQLQAQSTQMGDLIVDAVYYMDRYITPMTDAAVYQASSNMMNSTRALKAGHVVVGLYANFFVVPNRDRSFYLDNSQIKNLQLQGTSGAVLPSALGSDTQYTLQGQIDIGSPSSPNVLPFSLYTPQGINQETIIYPYIQAGVGLGEGFELSAKFSGHVQLTHGYYQVLGGSLKYNLGHWWPKWQKNKFDTAILVAYINEKVNYEMFKATDPTAQLLLGGIDNMLADVQSMQLQWNTSKTWGKLECMAGILLNHSNFTYKINGNDNSPLRYYGQSLNTLLNKQLTTISKEKWNLIGELSCRYSIWKHTFVQSTFAFGKFANWNSSIQFEF